MYIYIHIYEAYLNNHLVRILSIQVNICCKKSFLR